jgi:hypothetical protein
MGISARMAGTGLAVHIEIRYRREHMAAKFVIYKDKKEEFRWKLVHTNGQIIADSGEGYKAKESAKNGIKSVMENAPKASIEDTTV